MDELSRDLMRGVGGGLDAVEGAMDGTVGGLDAVEGAMDGNLTQWAQGAAVAKMADAGQQPQPRTSYSPPRPAMRPGAVLVLLVVLVVLVLIAVH